MVLCAAVGCNIRTGRKDRLTDSEGRKIGVHKFPTCEKRKKLWVKQLRRGSWTPPDTVSFGVCSIHFEDTCFINNMRAKMSQVSRQLTKEAIPTLYMKGDVSGFFNQPKKEGRSSEYLAKKERRDLIATAMSTMEQEILMKILVKTGAKLPSDASLQQSSSLPPEEMTPDSVSQKPGGRTSHSPSQEPSESSNPAPSKPRPWKCEECGADFTRSDNLKVHQKIHTGEKDLVCVECDARFCRPSDLKRHRKSHSGDKPYGCEVCDARFILSNHLRRHMLIHSGLKTFACDQCDAKFTQSCHLKEHARTHSGVKPFVCDDCGARFSQSSNLRRHGRVHGSDKSFVCCRCQASFITMHELRSHHRSHSGRQRASETEDGGREDCDRLSSGLDGGNDGGVGFTGLYPNVNVFSDGNGFNSVLSVDQLTSSIGSSVEGIKKEPISTTGSIVEGFRQVPISTTGSTVEGIKQEPECFEC